MSKELKIINQDGNLLIDSREVAKMVEKEHNHLMRDIRGYVKVLEDSPNLDSHNFFIESDYFNSQKKKQPCYLLTRKGCDIVANKMIGEKGVLFTATYVTKFEEMENKINSTIQILTKLELEQLIAREDGIIRRKRESQAISKMINNGETKGIKGSPYAIITNTTYDLLYGMYCADIKKELKLDEKDNLRDFLSKKDLTEIREIEDEIHFMSKKGSTWKEIYADLLDEYPNTIKPEKADKSTKELKKHKDIAYMSKNTEKKQLS